MDGQGSVTYVQWVRLRDCPDAVAPDQAHRDDAGWDLFNREEAYVEPLALDQWLGTGIAVAVPPGFYLRITGRSSVLQKWGVQIGEGIIDAGYRGELMIRVRNVRLIDTRIPAGTRLAQAILSPCPRTEFILAMSLPDAGDGRNLKGFGSSDPIPGISDLDVLDGMRP